MKEDFVDFETAILLEKKGFPQHTTTHTYFVGDNKQRGCAVGDFIGHPSEETDTHLIDAPTPQMVMKWLREEKHIFIQIMLDSFACGGSSGYYVVLQKTDSDYEHMLSDFVETVFYKTYEEAAEDAIKYCLTNLI